MRPLPLSWREGPIASGRVLLRQITGIGKSRLASVVFLLLGQSWEGKRGYSRVMRFHQSVFSADARLLCLLCRVGDSGPSSAVGDALVLWLLLKSSTGASWARRAKV